MDTKVNLHDPWLVKALAVLALLSCGCALNTPARYERAVVIRRIQHVSLTLDSPQTIACHQACLASSTFRQCIADCDGATTDVGECPAAQYQVCRPFVTQRTTQISGRCNEWVPLAIGEWVAGCRDRLMESANHAGTIVTVTLVAIAAAVFGVWVTDRGED